MIAPRVSRRLPGGWGFKPGKPPRLVQHQRIASALRASPDLLRLPKATLVRDVCQRFSVSRPTAYRVVEHVRA